MADRSPMGQLPNPYVVDEPPVLDRLLSLHLAVEFDEIPGELPQAAPDLLLKDLDLDAPREERDAGVYEEPSP